ncbi:MAG: patatin-like phospholipase family protein [Pseudomonadota bacterium]|nr:patatin-like phospholipase family protein [Pseudomonadota bacterium]
MGVLRALADEDIVPDLVAGCSMGAMIGASFAAGRIEQLEIWALALKWKGVVGLLDIGLRGGLIKGDRLLDFFRGQCAACQFSELPLPFAAVATDLASGEEIWLRDGKVSDAVRASCTVPGLFQPVLHNGRYLVDGSIVNPIPVSLCRAMGADIVIAVSLGSSRERRFVPDQRVVPIDPSRNRLIGALLPWSGNGADVLKHRAVLPLPSMADTMLGAIDIMQEAIAQRRLAIEPPDVLLTPRLGLMGPFEYYRAALAIAEGRKAVAKMLPAIRIALAA